MTILLKRYILVFPLALAFLCALSCSGVISGNSESDDNLRIDSLRFYNKYNNVKAYASVLDIEGRGADFEGNRASAVVSESSFLPLKDIIRNPIVLDSVSNLTMERFDSIGLKALVLVDLTLPQASVDAERKAVAQISNFIKDGNLYVSFLKSGGVVTESELCTEFMLDNRFYEDEKDMDKYLYSGIYSKFLEMDDPDGLFAGDSPKVLIVMSDGRVWGDDEPFDPSHFETQNKLSEYVASPKGDKLIFYSDFSLQNQEDMLSGSVNNTILSMCHKTGGLYQDKFNWVECCSIIENRYSLNTEDYIFHFSVPDGRVFSGAPNILTIQCLDSSDSLAFKGSSVYRCGSVFYPVVVNGVSDLIIEIRGIILGILILIFVFIALQFVLPFIKYNLFLKNNVITYRGPNMVVDGKNVADTCYLCKAPFVPGEKVVARCSHTMHKECWDENNYHCPEYGSRCKEGSHYYNSSNLWDFRNAPYYAKWIYFAIISGIIGWCYFYLASIDVVPGFVSWFVEHALEHPTGSSQYESSIMEYSSYVSWLPTFSLCLGVPLMIMLGFLVTRHTKWWKRVLEVVVRTAVGCSAATILFSLNSVIDLSLDRPVLERLIELVIWTAYTFWLAFCLTWRSTVQFHPRKVMRTFSVSILLIFSWSFFCYILLEDYRLFIILSYLVFTTGFALSIARQAPRSNRYVLHTEGCVKTTDIALYKWFRSNPRYVVSIGKSVDCSIQVNWDIKSNVAPRQAEVYMKDSLFYLRAVENGVVLGNGRLLREGQSVRLYHNDHFSIGTTVFTFRESDV